MTSMMEAPQTTTTAERNAMLLDRMESMVQSQMQVFAHQMQTAMTVGTAAERVQELETKLFTVTMDHVERVQELKTKLFTVTTDHVERVLELETKLHALKTTHDATVQHMRAIERDNEDKADQINSQSVALRSAAVKMAYGTSLWSKFMETDHDDADKMKHLQTLFQKTIKSIYVNEYLDLGKGPDVTPYRGH
eukprot:2150526-Rhodomonas_salina.1